MLIFRPSYRFIEIPKRDEVGEVQYFVQLSRTKVCVKCTSLTDVKNKFSEFDVALINSHGFPFLSLNTSLVNVKWLMKNLPLVPLPSTTKPSPGCVFVEMDPVSHKRFPQLSGIVYHQNQ